MRITPVVASVSILLAPGVARAADHLMKVSEVFLDDGTGAQYVEINDNGEPLTAGAPYHIAVYDADGSPLGTVVLPDLPANQGFYVIANDAAVASFGLVGDQVDAELTVLLPVDGQVCFERSTNTRIHCVAWGCINTVVGSPNRGASPPEGSSLSRPAVGTAYQVADPTPSTVNAAGDADPACPAEVIDAGPDQPDADVGGGPDAGDGGGDDGGGCCSTGRRDPAATLLLIGLVLLATARRSGRRR
jgi:hypothetical protein